MQRISGADVFEACHESHDVAWIESLDAMTALVQLQYMYVCVYILYRIYIYYIVYIYTRSYTRLGSCAGSTWFGEVAKTLAICSDFGFGV